MPRRLALLLLCLVLIPAAAPAAEAPERAVDPHAARMRFRFQDQEMDFVFGSLVLGAAINRGCEIGEAFATAARIKDGDAASWQAEWLRTAALVQARGEQALAWSHTVSARDQFLRACYYYRTAMVSMMPDDPRLRDTAQKSRSLLLRAGQFMDPPLEYVEIPFAGARMPGVFRKASPDNAPAKTLIMIGGAETFAEDQYFYIAPQAFERGYNFLTVDLPGQGLLPLQGQFFRPAMDEPLRAVVDYALSRKDVDPKRLAMYGISSGGGFVPQAAQHDKRITAVIMNNCVVDAGRGVAKMAVATVTPPEMAAWSSFKRQANQAIAWRFGLRPGDLNGLVKANQGFAFDPAQVQAPAFILVSSGEYKSPEIARQTEQCMTTLASAEKRLVITPAEEGASNHCVMENRSLMSQEIFDWLDNVFR